MPIVDAASLMSLKKKMNLKKEEHLKQRVGNVSF